MRLKTKPKKPENPQVRKRIDVEYKSVSDLNKIVEENGLDPKKVYIECETEWGYYDDRYATTFISVMGPKFTPDQFAKQMATYEKKLKTYNDWYEKNKKEIEAELKKRKEATVLAAKKKADKELAALEKQKADIEKKLAKLQKT